MKIAFEQVKEFHRVFKCAISDRPVAEPTALIISGTAALRISLMREELEETESAMRHGNMVEIADGLADLIYVAIGTAVVYGIPLDKVFEEVHRSNMAKAPDGVVKYRDDGKVLKPEGWTPPDIKAILDAS